MKTAFCKTLVGYLALSILSVCAALGSAPRERLLLDFGWKFHLGNEWGIAQNLAKAGTGSGPASMSFSDASWRVVNLPHDWAVELPFDPARRRRARLQGARPRLSRKTASAGTAARSTCPQPTPANGSGWNSTASSAIAPCFVNGWFVGHHESGYSSFRYDITDVANCGGKNVLAVQRGRLGIRGLVL